MKLLPVKVIVCMFYIKSFCVKVLKLTPVFVDFGAQYTKHNFNIW